MMAVSVGIAKYPYSSSSRLDWFHMVGAEITTVPQWLQVKVSCAGLRSSDLDACIATLQTGQGFSGISDGPISFAKWNLGIPSTTDVCVGLNFSRRARGRQSTVRGRHKNRAAPGGCGPSDQIRSRPLGGLGAEPASEQQLTQHRVRSSGMVCQILAVLHF